MAGVKVLLEVQQNAAEMGGVYHLILVVDDEIPYFKKGQAIADPSSKKDMTLEGLMRSRIFALLVWGGEVLLLRWKNVGIEVSRACDAAGWVEGLRGLQGLGNQSYRTFGLLSI